MTGVARSGSQPGGAVARHEAPLHRVAALPASGYVRPARRPGVFERPVLVDRLARAEDIQVAVVSAPAGYGKTTILALWDDADARPFAWVHLTPADDDPAHLLRHIALALDVLEPVPREVASNLGPGRPVDDDMLPSLGRWLQARPPLVLVLDDAHHLTSAETCRRVERLAAYLPERSQVALAGRSVGAFRLARLRLSGEVVAVGANDLAMSPEEAALLLGNLGVSVDEAGGQELVSRAEGWPAGLHLAALALASRGDADGGGIPTGADRLVGDYLVEEVLSGLPDGTVRIIEQSAVLERMSAPLLDEVLDGDRAPRVLDELERAGNMFLVPLDRQGEWYRYHHLFREVLRARLGRREPGTVQRLESRASRVLERRGDIDGALRHAASAGEVTRVADLVLRDTGRLVFQGDVARLGRWLELLGRDRMEQLPAAAMAWAWYGMAVGDGQLIQRAVLAAERQPGEGPLADGTPSVEVAVAMVKALTALDGVPGVIRDSERVRAAGGPATNPWWALATVVRGTAQSMLGELDEARDLLLEALPYVVEAPGIEAGTRAHLALIELRLGRRAEADRLATAALRIADRHDLEDVTIMVPVFAVGCLVGARHGRPGEARRAATSAQALLGRLDGLSPRTRLLGYLLLAEAAAALDHGAEARDLVEKAERARGQDGTATYLNQLLGLLREQLSTGTLAGVRSHSPMTPAELRVLALLPTHLSMQDIADRLLISRNTVKSHLVAIYRKLGVDSRGHAVLTAQRRGLLAP